MPNALGSVMRIPTENLLIQCILSKKNNTSWLQVFYSNSVFPAYSGRLELAG